MTADRLVAVIPPCAECGRFWWPLDTDHWQMDLIDHDAPELAFCCPECGEREFGHEPSA